MVTIWDAIEELITPPIFRKLVGGPSSNDYFKTFNVKFGHRDLQFDLPYGYVGCDGPLDQYNAYKWAASGDADHDLIVNLKTLDEDSSGFSHWPNAYYFQEFTWHYQAKLLFRTFFDTASITIFFLTHKTEIEISSLSDIEELVRKHYDDHVKDRENKFVPTKYETIEIDGVQWLKYSGNLRPHLTNRVEDNYIVPLDRHHFLMISIHNTIESRTGLFPQKVKEKIFEDAAALIAGVRFDPGKD